MNSTTEVKPDQKDELKELLEMDTRDPGAVTHVFPMNRNGRIRKGEKSLCGYERYRGEVQHTHYRKCQQCLKLAKAKYRGKNF